jgi:hypothetical protein
MRGDKVFIGIVYHFCLFLVYHNSGFRACRASVVVIASVASHPLSPPLSLCPSPLSFS